MSSICSNYGKTNRPTWISLWQVLLVAFVLVNWVLPVEADERVPVIRRFSGNVTDLNLLMLGPRSNIITTQKQWKTLWSQWRPDNDLYSIDLDKVLVLVETTPGPNRIFSNQLSRDSKGNLIYELAASEKAGAGFGYLIMVIDKSGINSIKGRPIGKSPIRPTVQPADPTIENNSGGDQTKQQNNERELVRVNMSGRVRTQLLVDSKDPIYVISANGIVWELDLGSNPQLLGRLRDANDALINVVGELSMERQRGARTAKLRYIVKVDGLDILKKSAVVNSIKVPPSTSPSIQPPLENPPSVDTRIMKPTTPQNPKAQTLPRAMAFSEISLITSDGQLQTILADGSIHYESKSRKISRDWKAKPEEMGVLNQFVKDTDWDSVPKLTRADEGTENEVSYTISIKSSRFVRRIFVDRSKISSQPQIKSLFGILGGMAKGN